MGERSGRVAAGGLLFLVGVYVLLEASSGRLFSSPLEPSALRVPAGALEWARAALGLVITLLVPGAFLALRVTDDGPRDNTWLLLRALGFSLVAHVLNLTLLKLAGVSVTPALMLGLGGVEAAAGRVALRRGMGGGLEPVSLNTWGGAGAVALLVAYLLVAHHSYLVRELGDYWYAAEAMGEEAEDEGMHLAAAGLSLERADGWERVSTGERDFFRKSISASETLVVRAVTVTRPTLRYLYQGPVGSRFTVDCEDTVKTGEIERAPVENPDEGPTLRSLDRGIVLVSVPLTVRQERRCQLVPSLPAGQAGTLVDLTGWPMNALPEPAALGGWTLVHYYQILNIAENVEWARRTLVDQWVTINQPPLWSYVYAAVVLYVGNGLWAVNLFFFVMIGLTVFFAARLVRLEHGEVPLPLWVPLLLLGVSHARIIVSSGSTNFPDNLYAFSLVAMLYALVQGRGIGYASTGAATVLLRYAGAAPAALAPLIMLWTHPGRRRAIVRAAVWCVLVVGVVCVAFLVAASVTGQLEQWLEILYFETLPEHFHGQYDPGELLQRPPEFYGILLRYSGYTPLLLVGFRGRLARLVTLLAAVYTLFLCFIDHFPTHYFVPLLYLIGIGVTATLMTLPPRLRWPGLGLSCVGLLYGLQAPV